MRYSFSDNSSQALQTSDKLPLIIYDDHVYSFHMFTYNVVHKRKVGEEDPHHIRIQVSCQNQEFVQLLMLKQSLDIVQIFLF